MKKRLSREEFLKDLTSYGLHGLDTRLKEFLTEPGGVFVEAGANDGVTQSNTRIFEELFGFTGVLVEPAPSLVRTCAQNRPGSAVVHAALVGPDHEGSHVAGDFCGALMGSVLGARLGKEPTHRVPARTLTSICREKGLTRIDLLSLDVEGHELPALLGLDLSEFRPRYILIEIYRRDQNEIVSWLQSAGYRFVRNLSDFQVETHPHWDGTHNDYLFTDDALRRP